MCRYCGAIILLLICVCIGCSSISPQEPQGKAVELTEEDLKYATQKDEKIRMWYAWQGKGLELAEQKRYEEALYCYHQAVKIWPKKKPSSHQEDQRKFIRHFPEPTSTLLQIGFLYIRMREPEWALVYFDKFESYLPGDKNTYHGRAIAYYMLKNYEKSLEYCNKNLTSERELCQIIEGAIYIQKGSREKGLNLIKQAWGQLKDDIHKKPYTYKDWLYNQFWSLLPNDIQNIIIENFD